MNNVKDRYSTVYFVMTVSTQQLLPTCTVFIERIPVQRGLSKNITEGLIQDLRQMDRYGLSGVLYNTHHVTHRCNRESPEITLFHVPLHKIKNIEYLIFLV